MFIVFFFSDKSLISRARDFINQKSKYNQNWAMVFQLDKRIS